MHARVVRHRAAIGVGSLAFVALACVAPLASAQKWSVGAGLDSRVETSTNNDLGDPNGVRDSVVIVRPHVDFRREGGKLRMWGFASLDAELHANSGQPNKVTPTADVNARLEAVERLLFLEAGYRAVRTSADPFGARSDSSTNSSTITASQARFSPSIEANTGTDLHLRVRSDNTLTHEFGSKDPAAASGGGYFGHHSASFERDPRPLGFRLAVERSQTRYASGTRESLTVDVARASVSYLVAQDLSAGVRVGHERNPATDAGLRRSIYGLEANWTPSQRTSLDGFVERRSFGTGWSAAFKHRQPQVAWDMSISRDIASTPQSLLELPATQDVTGLIDAMLTTRFPDPIERARAVQDLMASRGLSNTTLAPVTLFSERFSLVNRQRASLSVLGIRNTLTFGAFHVRTQDLPGVTLLDTGTERANNVQVGLSVSLAHKLAADLNVKVLADWSRIRSVGFDPVDTSTERGLSVQFDLTASPKTNAYFGGKYRKLDSTIATPGREGRVYLGLDHRF